MSEHTSKKNMQSPLYSLLGVVSILALIIIWHDSVYADEWVVDTDISEMDDSKSVYLSVDSRLEIPNTLGLGTVRPILWIRCLENRTSVFVSWGRYISTGGLDNGEPIRYRIDDQEPQTSKWNLSTNFEATGLWSGGQSIPFIRKLIQANRLLVEVTPYGESAVRADFPLTGLEDHIADVQSACHWQ